MKIIHFADLHLGVESYGRLDPATGLSSRFIDFTAALDKLIDAAIEEKVDLVLFCGDAYKSREPNQTQQREFARRISRLSKNGIPVFLLIGNHDLPSAISRATTTEIFTTLDVPNVYVANRPETHLIPTKSGPVQIVSLPWPRRSLFLTKEETKDLDLEQINQKLQQMMTNIIAVNADALDPRLPAILAAHVWVAGSQVGSERVMNIGRDHVLLLSNIANPAFDYVALGHIHKHQILAQNPPVVYSGSLEKLDFGEEADPKGFCLVEIEDAATGKRQVKFTFREIKGRSFLTIDVDVAPGDSDPTAAVLQAIAVQGEKLKDGIVRLNISLPAEIAGQLRDGDIREKLREAHYAVINKDVRRETRFRLGKMATQEITPLDALKTYLESKKFSPERAKLLLEYGERLIEEHRVKEG